MLLSLLSTPIYFQFSIDSYNDGILILIIIDVFRQFFALPLPTALYLFFFCVCIKAFGWIFLCEDHKHVKDLKVDGDTKFTTLHSNIDCSFVYRSLFSVAAQKSLTILYTNRSFKKTFFIMFTNFSYIFFCLRLRVEHFAIVSSIQPTQKKRAQENVSSVCCDFSLRIGFWKAFGSFSADEFSMLEFI